jgi:hypothetical protein
VASRGRTTGAVRGLLAHTMEGTPMAVTGQLRIATHRASPPHAYRTFHHPPYPTHNSPGVGRCEEVLMHHGMDAAKSALACADILASVLTSKADYGTLRGSSVRERGLATLYRRFLGEADGDDGGDGEEDESNFATFDNEAVCGRHRLFPMFTASRPVAQSRCLRASFQAHPTDCNALSAGTLPPSRRTSSTRVARCCAYAAPPSRPG